MRDRQTIREAFEKRGSDDRRRRFFAVLLGAIILRSVAPGAVNYLSNRHVVEEPVEWSSPAIAVAAGAAALMLGVVALVFGFTLSRRFALGGRILLLLCIVVGYFVRSQGLAEIDLLGVIDLLSMVATVVAVALLRPQLQDLRFLAFYAAAISVYAIAFTLVRPQGSLMIDSYGGYFAHKAIISSWAVAGPMGHANTFGAFLVLATPWALFIRARLARNLILMVLLFGLVASASRTSLSAAAACGIFLAVSSIAPRIHRRGVAYLALAVSCSVVVAMPFLATAETLNGRSDIWKQSLAVFSDSGYPMLGRGAFWSEAAASAGAELPLSTSAHNLFVQWLIIGGPILLMGGILFARRVVKVALLADSRLPSPALMTYVIALLVVSSNEFVLVFDPAFPTFSVTTVALVVIASGNVSRVPLRRQASDSQTPVTSKPGESHNRFETVGG